MLLIPIHNTGDPITAPNGLPAAGCIIDCLLVDATTRRPCSVWDAVSGELVTLATASVTCDVNGEIPLDAETDVSTLQLWPNDRGNIATLYRITARNGEFLPFHAALASDPATQTFIGFMAQGQTLTPAELAEMHTHANKTTLDKITEEVGYPLWNGAGWPGGRVTEYQTGTDLPTGKHFAIIKYDNGELGWLEL